MAIFSITIEERENLPPNQIGAFRKQLGAGVITHTITVDELTTQSEPPYQDPEGDPLLEIKIIDIGPNNQGEFLKGGSPISIGTTLLAADIDLGSFTYEGLAPTDVEYSDYFLYDVADTGSQTYGGLKGFYQLDIIQVKNLPPVVGDASETIEYGDSLVFTKEMFVDNTHPSYTDPEGDAPYKLRIDTLPNKGYITFEGMTIEAGDEFDFADIVLGKLTYIPDLSATETQDVEFEFSVSDEGSKEFGT